MLSALSVKWNENVKVFRPLILAVGRLDILKNTD